MFKESTYIPTERQPRESISATFLKYHDNDEADISNSLAEMDRAIDHSGINNDYSVETVNKDKENIKARHEIYKKTKDINGSVFELIYKEVIKAGAFPEGVTVAATNLYDDYNNHMDFLLTINGVKIGLDITVGESSINHNSKLSANLDMLDSQGLGKLKYHTEPGTEKPGPIKNIPIVVIEIPPDDLDGVCEEIINLGGLENPANIKKFLIDSYIAESTIEQTLKQLTEQAYYLQKKYLGSNEQNAAIFDSMLGTILDARDAIAKIKNPA